MPRPPRHLLQARGATTTPTRPTITNAITGAIPPFMLQTPPHAPFLTSPLPPANNPIIPNQPVNPQYNLQHNDHTPTANATGHNNNIDQAQDSTHALGDNLSDTEPADDDSLLDSAPHDPDDSRQLIGLRDISSLATWTLSSAKPGCALQQLRHPSPTQFWQSDGPQPHTLTLHFFKLVAIVKMRIYLDFELDESYTPTKMRFFAGMSESGLVEFGSWEVPESIDPETGEPTSGIEQVRSWMDISLKGVGGRDTRYHEEETRKRRKRRAKKSERYSPSSEDDDATDSPTQDDDVYEDDYLEDYTTGDVLKAMVVQIRICENHQNGKDTHVRGFQVFARDEAGGKEGKRTFRRRQKNGGPMDNDDDYEEADDDMEVVGIHEADWMGEPELR